MDSDYDDIDRLRLNMTLEEQAAFMRDAYLMIDKESQEAFFLLMYKAKDRAEKRKFRVIPGGAKRS